MPVYSELKDYPIVDQVSTKTLDHGPDTNHWFQCVQCDLVSAILYYHPEYRGKIDPDMLMDMVLGPNHTGGSDAASFVNIMVKYGVKLSSVNGLNPGQQIIAAHHFIQQGKAVIFTQIDRYVNPSLGYTHVSVFFKEVPNGLVAMDSLGDGVHITGGQYVTKTDAEWMSLLRGDVLWLAEKLTEPQQVPAIHVPTDWKDDNVTLTSPSGFSAQHGFREYILTHQWNPANHLMSNEYSGNNGTTVQDCLFCTLSYNPKDGSISFIEGDAFSQRLWNFLTHQSTLLSQDKALIASLQSQTDNLTSQLQTAQNRLSELQNENTKLQVQLNTITTTNTKLFPLLQGIIQLVQQDTALLQVIKPFVDALKSMDTEVQQPSQLI